MLTWPGLDAVRPLLLWASQLNSAGSLSPAGKTQPCSLHISKPSQSHQLLTCKPSGFPFLAFFSLPSVALLLPVPGGDPGCSCPTPTPGARAFRGCRTRHGGDGMSLRSPCTSSWGRGCFPSKRGKAESRTAPTTAWSDDVALVKDCSNPPADGGEGPLEIPRGGLSRPA